MAAEMRAAASEAGAASCAAADRGASAAGVWGRQTIRTQHTRARKPWSALLVVPRSWRIWIPGRFVLRFVHGVCVLKNKIFPTRA
eukprot:2221321-Prymnesium_polylepis.1